MSGKDNLVAFGIKLEVIVLKVGTTLSKELLESLFVFLIRAGLVYLVGLGLLDRVELHNLLLELSNLVCYLLGSSISSSRGLAIVADTRGGWNLRYYRVFILLSRLII
jgi:hypothetical protein